MPKKPLENFICHLYHLTAPPELQTYSDQQLLQRCQTDRDEVAYGVLVRRHGAMVWKVCWGVLGHCQDAEDAFQATFMRLSQRMKSTVWRESIEGWLHTVAYEVAMKTKVALARRHRHEQARATMQEESYREPTWRRELEEVLHRELERLPEKYRSPLILCYLEGLTCKQAAQRMGISERCLEERLARGKKRLHARLCRHGMELGPTMLMAGLPLNPSLPEIPPGLVLKTIDMAHNLIKSQGVLEVAGISPQVTMLTQSVLGFWTLKMKILMSVLLIALAGVGGGMAKYAGWISFRSEQPELALSDLADKQEHEPGMPTKQPVRTDRYGDPLPEGALARLGTTRMRAIGGSFWSLAFTNDGKELITDDGSGGAPSLWDLMTGRLIHQFGERDHSQRSIALSPDNRILATERSWGNKKFGLFLWDVTKGKVIQEIQSGNKFGHNFQPIGFSFDGKAIAIVSREKEAKLGLYSINENRFIWKKTLPSHIVLDMLPDRKTLVWSNVKSIYFVDVGTGKELRHWEGKGEQLMIPRACSPDGRLMVMLHRMPKYMDRNSSFASSVWDIATKKEIYSLADPGAHIAAFSPDNKVLATGNRQGEIYLWDAATGKKLRRYYVAENGWPHCLAFSPDGKMLAAGYEGYDKTVHLWDLETEKKIGPLFDGHRSAVHSIQFLPNGQEIRSLGWDGVVRTWNAINKNEQTAWTVPHDRLAKNALYILNPYGTRQSCWEISSDGRLIAECIYGNDAHNRPSTRVRIIQAKEDGESDEVCCIRVVGKLTGVTFSPNTKYLACLKYNHEGKSCGHLFEIKTGKEWCSFVGTAITFTPDSKVMFVSGDHENHGCIVNVDTGKVVDSFPECKGSHTMIVSPNGRTLAIVGGGYPIRLWSISTGNRTSTPREYRQTLAVRLGLECKPVFSPDSKILAAADTDNTIHLWETASGQERKQIKGQVGRILTLTFSPDGHRLASGGHDTTILLWDITSRLNEQGMIQPIHLSSKQKELLWKNLAEMDGTKSSQAIWSFTASGASTVSFLRSRLLPTPPVTAAAMSQLIADLDNDSFAVRNNARQKLTALEEVAEPAIRQALMKNSVKRNLTAEVRRTLEQLLLIVNTKRNKLSNHKLREIRAIEVLEHIGTREARQFLKTLSEGAPEAYKTQEAQAALNRLNARVQPKTH